MGVINQIFEYINGKPTPNHQIRAWGDSLKVRKTSELGPPVRVTDGACRDSGLKASRRFRSERAPKPHSCQTSGTEEGTTGCGTPNTSGTISAPG